MGPEGQREEEEEAEDDFVEVGCHKEVKDREVRLLFFFISLPHFQLLCSVLSFVWCNVHPNAAPVLIVLR